MTPEEIAAARKWIAEEKWTKVSVYGRAVVTKLIDEIERLNKRLEWWETPAPEPAAWDEATQ